MQGGQYGGALRHIHVLYQGGAVGGLTDGQLLERFAGSHDETAFTALVERHGPMVLHVCRGVLNDPHDAQDAFQAAFLVLARKAGSIRKRESVASWLHGVAYRIASSARSAASRRRRHEHGYAEMAVATYSVAGDLDDLKTMLHEEIWRLPQRYRAAIVLCYFEGLTHEQAARQLGWPVGTVRSRLARGRERLRRQLTRRGLAPALGAGLTASSKGTAVPTALVNSTLQAVMQFVAHKATTAGILSATTITLTKGALKTMFLTKLRVGAMVLLAFGAVAVGALVVTQQGAADEPTQARKEPGSLERYKKLVAQTRELRSQLQEAEAELRRVKETIGSPDNKPAASRLDGKSQLNIDDRPDHDAVVNLAIEGGEAFEIAGVAKNPLSQATAKQLAKPIDMTFIDDKMTLEAVLFDIRKETSGPDTPRGIPIYVDPFSLKEAGITMKTPVNFVLNGTPLRTSLYLLLREWGLTYGIKDGVLVIASKGEISKLLEDMPDGPTSPDALQWRREQVQKLLERF